VHDFSITAIAWLPRTRSVLTGSGDSRCAIMPVQRLRRPRAAVPVWVWALAALLAVVAAAVVAAGGSLPAAFWRR